MNGDIMKVALSGGTASMDEQYINLQAGVIYDFEAHTDFNTAIVYNYDPSAVIYLDLRPIVSPTGFMTKAVPGAAGVIVDPHDRRRVYLYSAAAINGIRIQTLRVDNPVLLLDNLVQSAGSSDVSVVATVGLKSIDLSIDPTTKSLLTSLDSTKIALSSEKGVGTNTINDILVNNASMFGLSNLSASVASAGGTLNTDIISTTKDIDIIQISGRTGINPGQLTIIEAPTVTSAGSTIASYNTNRTSTVSATATARSASNLTAGTIIYDQVLTSGGTLQLGHFWRFKKSVVYQIKLTNYGTTPTRMSLGIAFREL